MLNSEKLEKNKSKYYKSHYQKIACYNKDYYRRNWRNILEKTRNFYYADIDKSREKQRINFKNYYDDHRQKCLQKSNSYRENHPEYYKEYYANHRKTLKDKAKQRRMLFKCKNSFENHRRKEIKVVSVSDDLNDIQTLKDEKESEKKSLNPVFKA
jgi:hypothetical protein